jgi:hypothetical protein
MALYAPSMIPGLLKGKAITKEQITDLEYEGKVIIAARQGGKPRDFRMKKTRATKVGFYTEAKKVETATLYAALGDVKATAKLAKVPVEQVEKWQDEEWWLLTLAKVKRNQNSVLDVKASTIVDKAMDQLLNRVEQGDHILNIKTGEIVQIPMSGRDLSVVAGTIFDKRQLIRGEATKISKAVNSEEFLEKLADKFKEFARQSNNATKRPPAVISSEEIEDLVNEANQ